MPKIASTHSLVAKHVTPEKWAKLGGIKTKTSGFTLAQVSGNINWNMLPLLSRQIVCLIVVQYDLFLVLL